MLFHWLLVVVALAVVGAIDTDDDCCSTEDKKEVAFMWHQVWHTSYTERKVKIMRAIWDDLVHKHPEAKEFLAKVGITSEDSPEFRAHVIRTAHGLDNLINLLDEPLVLEEQLHFMADKFGAKVGVKKSYFEAIADSFETILPKVSTCFNVGAWNRCLNKLAQAIGQKLHD